MNNIKDFIDKYDLNVRGYEEKNNIRIIDTDKGKYVIKPKKKYDNGLYQYLVNKNFDYILEREEFNDYEVYPYINEVEAPSPEKAIELVYTLSILHNKTTYYREVSIDKVKELYEKKQKEINYLEHYYHDMQDMIEQKVYMSPGEYLLIRNMSMIYSALGYSKIKLDEWYEYKIKQKKERIVLLHNKPCVDHFLMGNKRFLISWDDYTRDIPIYDFLYFYKHDYMGLEMSTLFDVYKSKFYYTKDEKLLFLSLISIPEKITFSNSNYINCLNVHKLVKYIAKTRDFTLKENEEKEKEYHDEFNE